MFQILRFLLLFLVIFLQQISYCSAGEARQVVVYTALDQIFSEPIFKEFEQTYNIQVKAVYDIEAVKTTGLVNRLIAEKNNPQCDVFWNNEVIRTIALKRMGIITPYISPSSWDIPEQFKDRDGYWAGFAARARVLLVNTDLVKKEDYPSSIAALADAKWKGKGAMANPLFGTTATHISAMFATDGAKKAEKYLADILANDIKIVDGNSVVRDMVASGEVFFGITDTDDANGALVAGKPVKMIIPDQNGAGTLLIPNTIAMINNAPHQEEGKLLIDFILSKAVEARLAAGISAQIPLREGSIHSQGNPDLERLLPIDVDYEKMTDVMEESVKVVQQLFMR